MKIEIHVRTTKTNGEHRSNALFVESCRVYREAGDGVRLNNLAVNALLWFRKCSKIFANGKFPSAAKLKALEEMDVSPLNIRSDTSR